MTQLRQWRTALLLHVLFGLSAHYVMSEGADSAPLETASGKATCDPCVPVSQAAAEHTCSHQQCCHARLDELNTLRDGPQLIVRFKEYLQADTHHAGLSSQVAGEGRSWRWVERHNKAAGYPTDFALIVVPQHSQAVVQEQVGLLPHVKDLHIDKQFHGRLHWQPEGELKDAILSFGQGSSNSGEADQERAHSGKADSDADTGSFDFSVSKPPGRLSTSFMMDPIRQHPAHDRQLLNLDPGSQDSTTPGSTSQQQQQQHPSHHHQRGSHHDSSTSHSTHQSASRRLLIGRSSLTSQLNADEIWRQGFTGQGVKVGVFDTGIKPAHPHIRNIKERTDWTHQNSLADGLGHGTFVAGVIGSQDHECPGLAPDVELHTFKVFTDDQISFTSWFLDAFNYAMLTGVHVINLSIGGPDFLDQPFVEKVWEVTSSGVLLVSAIGNDGPLYGTLNNPADQNDVIGVGGIDDFHSISSFSSRGMTSWEFPTGSGRIKPDVMAYSKDVHGSKIQGGCRTLSGTSVASPVVAGAVCLLASTVPEPHRWAILNPASMKQALIEGADRLGNLNTYEQGAGKINLLKSMSILQDYQPRASVVPAQLDLTDGFMWPYSKQPMYAGALPLIFNATVLNALGVHGHFSKPPEFYATDEGGALLHVAFEYSQVLWPWSGFLALYLRVREAGRTYKGTASGKVVFTISSPPGDGESQPRSSTVVMPVKVAIQPPPPKAKRLLWDQLHSIKYPPGYVPRDNLDIKHDILDWHGDHLFTNYNGLYNALKEKGYFIEVLSSPATCFDATEYGALLLVDSEDEYYKEEVSKLARDVADKGLSLVVFAEWYHVDSMLSMKFYDDNTRSWWTPVTGGANVPALNDLLAPYNISLGDSIIHGSATAAGFRLQLAHGADIAELPPNSHVYKGSLNAMSSKSQDGQYAYLGISPPIGPAGGHVAVFSDSNCLDSSHQVHNCYDFLVHLLDHVTQGKMKGFGAASDVQSAGWRKPNHKPPQRRTDINFTDYSFVLKHPLTCYGGSHCQFLKTKECADFLNPAARTTLLDRDVQPTTNVRIAMGASSGDAGGTIGQAPMTPTPANPLASSVINRLVQSTTFAISSSMIHMATFICVAGLIVVLVIWQCGGKARSSRGADRRTRGGLASVND